MEEKTWFPENYEESHFHDIERKEIPTAEDWQLAQDRLRHSKDAPIVKEIQAKTTKFILTATATFVMFGFGIGIAAQGISKQHRKHLKLANASSAMKALFGSTILVGGIASVLAYTVSKYWNIRNMEEFSGKVHNKFHGTGTRAKSVIEYFGLSQKEPEKEAKLMNQNDWASLLETFEPILEEYNESAEKTNQKLLKAKHQKNIEKARIQNKKNLFKDLS
eukprot:TRINITY_DN12326_c0_g1_i1.p1 TRINITY_DN12326_c0_g1~~TRINITY_DN12326_c0_g1_i1.p1  ORF type:complete len:237 (-),score=45.26 TRINITY_DN12326_c0_g1_i1:85-744(-)